ncbi:MAG: septum formation initiator family protein [Eubacteriales bacterium]|nr:septum formation initiator family protein [Eubacteriales bacterium]
MARNSWRVKPRFWLILIVLILSVFMFLDANQNKMIDQREAVLQELQKTKEDLEVRVASDQRKLEFSKSDDYIERMARIHLQMVMPNEILYVESDTH